MSERQVLRIAASHWPHAIYEGAESLPWERGEFTVDQLLTKQTAMDLSQRSPVAMSLFRNFLEISAIG
jgi:hypothetical protein